MQPLRGSESINFERTIEELQAYANASEDRNNPRLLKLCTGSDGKKYLEAMPRSQMTFCDKIRSFFGYGDWKLGNVVAFLQSNMHPDQPLPGAAVAKLSRAVEHFNAHWYNFQKVAPASFTAQVFQATIKPSKEPSKSMPTSPISSLSSATVKKKEKKTRCIVSEKNIPGLTELNGVPISIIEERARPGKGAQSGFLGKDERLIDVLKKDWETVRKLGVTHRQLANCLQCLMEVAPERSTLTTFQIKDGFISVLNATSQDAGDRPISENSLKGELGFKGGFIGKYRLREELQCEVFKIHSRGKQYDIFRPTGSSEDTAGIVSPWGTECRIRVSGAQQQTINVNPGVLAYIRNFGFYEGGGKSNRYRVDPVTVVSILTGVPEMQIRKECGIKE